MIFIPQSSLKNLNSLTLEVSNWSGNNTFEFEISPYEDEKVKFWKKIDAVPSSKILSLEGAFEGNILDVQLTNSKDY